MKEYNYETIKAKAKRQLSDSLRLKYGAGSVENYRTEYLIEAMPTVLTSLLSGEQVDRAIRIGSPGETITDRSLRASTIVVGKLEAVVKGWEQQAHREIDNWDVRNVGKLIELFPNTVAARYRKLPITVYMADEDDCPWKVVFGDQDSRPAFR